LQIPHYRAWPTEPKNVEWGLEGKYESLGDADVVARQLRYVVVSGEVVTGSAYVAEQRASSPDAPGGAPWRFSADVARELAAPEAAYVLDVCEAEGGLHLLELNPFSGADPYACDRTKIVDTVSRLAASMADAASRTS
jgi:hypothetical protein